MSDEMSESILEIALDRTPDEMSEKNADKKNVRIQVNKNV